jgi:hypothetical protein
MKEGRLMGEFLMIVIAALALGIPAALVVWTHPKSSADQEHPLGKHNEAYW